MVKYRILIERKGQENETQYTADDGRIYLAEMSQAELWNLYHMCELARAEIYSMISLKGDGERQGIGKGHRESSEKGVH